MSMTKETLAAQLDGRQITLALNDEIESKARDNGLVIIFGVGDDLVELRGAIDEELNMGNYTEWVRGRTETTSPSPTVLFKLDCFMESGNIDHLYIAAMRFIDNQYGGDIAKALLELSVHFEDGARKYDDNNWKKGMPVRCYVDSAIRHYIKLQCDWPDEPHDRAVLWNIVCGIWTATNKPELNEYAPRKEQSHEDCKTQF